MATKKSSSKVTTGKFGGTKGASKAAFAAANGTRQSAEHITRLGANAVRDFMSSSAGEAQKAQEKMFEFSRETAENFSRSAEAASRSVGDAVSMTRDNMEACIECSNIAADMSKSFSAEVFNTANETFSENVEMMKEMFRCRTLNDMFELQSKMARTNMDKFFSETSRISEMFFRYATEAAEPINERVAEATQRFTKNMAA